MARPQTPQPGSRPTATEQARLGNTDAALEALITFSKRGDAAASASVAQLLAFRGQWSELLPYALDLLTHPDAVYAGNVFSDLCLLMRRVAEVLDDPDHGGRSTSVSTEKRGRLSRRTSARVVLMMPRGFRLSSVRSTHR